MWRVGVVLAAHKSETFPVETETEVLTLRLNHMRARFGEAQPHGRYRFAVLDRQARPDEGSATADQDHQPHEEIPQ